ncbi:MAG TPA: class I SAM-dependent methyltransferase [Planctomycetota bacterium]|nr:class I SAM-dependent methyltransferase [Planctomycetota bacterium]
MNPIAPGDLAYSAKERNPVVLAFLHDQLGPADAHRLNVDIHAADEMLSSLPWPRDQRLLHYFQSGRKMIRAIEQIAAWRFGSLGVVRAMLDFACGYGRLGRWLGLHLPRERIWSSDISADGVAFQRERFGHHGIVSVADPAEFHCAQRFDLIFVASLFSHLPEATFGAWLERLWTLLADGGVLVFSVHGEAIVPAGMTMPAGGILFAPESESATLDTAQYGTTWVSEAFVHRAVRDATGGRVPVRIPRGLCDYQDLYLVTKGRASDPAALAFDHGPQGAVDIVALETAHDLFVEGWAADNTPGSRITTVEILLDGRIVQRCLPDKPRPEVAATLREPGDAECGWSARVRLEAPLQRDNVLLVRATNARGSSHVLGVVPTTRAPEIEAFPAYVWRWPG